MNPYAGQLKSEYEKKSQGKIDFDEKENDVFFDKKKGKLIIKDLEKKSNKKTHLIGAKNLTDKPDDALNINIKFQESISTSRNSKNLLNNKRVKNVRNDKDELSDDENKRTMKRKIDQNEEVIVKSSKNYIKSKDSHVVKFSGDEYKNKTAGGDKLLQGKYEPFSYIQLNPKSTSKKGRKEAMKVFEGVMNSDKKHK